MYPVDYFGWEEELSYSFLKNQCQVDFLIEESRVWKMGRGSDKNGCFKESFFFTIIWGLLQSCETFVENATKCNNFDLSSKLGGFGSLIPFCRWWCLHLYDADMRGIGLNIKYEKEKFFFYWKTGFIGSL